MRSGRVVRGGVASRKPRVLLPAVMAQVGVGFRARKTDGNV